MKLSDRVASWFFRLNGCAVIENFIVHPELGFGGQNTDLDLYGVRFPHRAEEGTTWGPFPDDPLFTDPRLASKIQIVFAEVTNGQCKLNGPWTDPEKRNMERVIRAVGVVPPQGIPRVVSDLHARGEAVTDSAVIRMFAVGNRKVAKLPAVQIIWPDILGFIYDRMLEYERVKTQADQWDTVGRRLRTDAVGRFRKSREEFIERWGLRITRLSRLRARSIGA